MPLCEKKRITKWVKIIKEDHGGCTQYMFLNRYCYQVFLHGNFHPLECLYVVTQCKVYALFRLQAQQIVQTLDLPLL